MVPNRPAVTTTLARLTSRRVVLGCTIFSATIAWLVACGEPEQADCPRAGDGSCMGGAGSNDGAPAAQVSRFARLTHAQWQNTVGDLLGASGIADFSPSFRPDPNQQGYLFDNDANSLSIDQALWQAYQGAATQIAAVSAEDPALLAGIVPTAERPDAIGRAFIEQFGRRVHRRPLSEAQVESYLELYSGARDIFPELGPVEAGVRLLLQAFLQSPYFLYRVEDGVSSTDRVVPLDGYEIAARLSYTLWDTMPDESLFRAAESGELASPAKVAEQARRMLDGERAAPVLARLHRQLFDVERYRGISRFPEEGLPAMAEEGHRRFIRHVAFDQSGSLLDLLTSTQTFANATLAGLYGLSGNFTEEFELVDLDPEQRSGFLTQIGFLASNANSGVPDPIHRGVFLARRIACLNLPMPPNNIPPLPAAGGRTNRETVAAHTETPGTVCAGCHGPIINPLGFPFEYYDGLGRYRTEDNGQAVNGTTSPALEGNPTVADAVELAHALASSQQVHECYAKHLLEFAFGRLSTKEDQGLIEQAAKSSKDENKAVKELVVQLVSSQPFLTRSREEF
jgi:hypothetical protein